MTVDEYKKKYGSNSPSGFWDVGNVTHLPVIPCTLYDMISQTIDKLNKVYVPFVCLWVWEKKPKIREEIREIEGNINVAVLCEDEGYLRSELGKYYEVWVRGIREFEGQKDKYIPF